MKPQILMIIKEKGCELLFLLFVTFYELLEGSFALALYEFLLAWDPSQIF